MWFLTTFQWTASPLRSWRSQIFSKIIPNRRGSVDNHTILGLDTSSTLPLCFFYASVTLLLSPHYDNEDLATLSLRWWRWGCDLATTLAMELRFCCAFISFLYLKFRYASTTTKALLLRFYCSSTALLLRFYCALAVSATIRVILTKISNRSGIAVQWNWGGGGDYNVISIVSFLLEGPSSISLILFYSFPDMRCHNL